MRVLSELCGVAVAREPNGRGGMGLSLAEEEFGTGNYSHP